ncbi:MAG: response regulator [Halobacteriota archaeon]
MEYNILLVDDEKNIHKLLPRFLARSEQHKFIVHSAINGKEGVEMYSKLVTEGHKPDFVLMDLRMPVMDGVEATRRIIKNEPDATIYLFTAYAGTNIEAEALEAGAKGTISKIDNWTRTVEEIVSIPTAP